jgi:hypothetical protein
MTDYAAVLTRRHAGRQWVLNGNEYNQLIMLDDGETPSKTSLDAAWPAVQAEIAAECDAQAAARTSGLAKLSALGLTDAEIAALVG